MGYRAQKISAFSDTRKVGENPSRIGERTFTTSARRRIVAHTCVFTTHHFLSSHVVLFARLVFALAVQARDEQFRLANCDETIKVVGDEETPGNVRLRSAIELIMRQAVQPHLFQTMGLVFHQSGGL